jgi:opacity protein-like surface antigen
MLKWCASAIAAAAAMLAFATPSCAQLYLSGSGGYLDLQNLRGARSAFSADADFENSYLLNAAIGYRFRLPSVNLRLEIEGGYGKADVKSVSITTPSGGTSTAILRGGNSDLYTATINGFVEFPITPLVSPYVGAGIGAAYTDLPSFSTAGGDVTFRGGSNANLLILGEAGLSFNLGDNLAIVPAYRYLRFNSEISGVNDIDAHVFKLGLRFTF